jgi:glutamate-ammonia-ligase adenylyltransferase
VEWVIQLLQLRHGHNHEQLRTPRTLAAMDAAVQLGLLESTDYEVLKSAWKTCSRVRNANLLLKGKASDLVPSDVHDRARVAWLLGFGQAGGTAFDDEYRRRTRRARGVMERLFFDS